MLQSSVYATTFDKSTVKHPNIVLIMADDLGYSDLSCYGSQTIRTPVLDQLAGDGIRLTSFYAGCTICTPSRMALLTGAYPPRMGWRGGVVGYGVKTRNGLSPDALTIGEMFRDAGYRTALIGKWHLGDTPELSPMNQGFLTAFYIDKSNNQTKKLWRGGKLVADPFDNRRLTEQFTKAAIRFIEADRDRPFFLYLPLSAPHFPAQAHPDWQGKSRNNAYGDVVEELDSRVGEILRSLAQHKLADSTIVVFLSDNGVEPGQKKWARSDPYRGLKWSALEGGNRVPCIVRWPGVIPAGRVSGEITAAIDLLPTLAHACGIDLEKISSASPKIDGVNVWKTLVAEPDSPHARTELLYWHGWGVLQAIRVGDWKLYLDQVKEIAGSGEGPVLINLATDVGEQTNLSDKHPQRVREMKQLALQRLREIEANAIPLGGPVTDDKPEKKRALWLK
ncbi:MAG: sulfatase-like hydrolase/transferase [Pirellulaceae bacterium]|nr:sulfatase-like hydrolase/transferase [Pirellulaceae bacterium]